MFDEILKLITQDGSLSHFTNAQSKETDNRKQRGFYVDLGKNLEVKSTPLAVSRETAQEQFDFLTKTLRSISTALDERGE